MHELQSVCRKGYPDIWLLLFPLCHSHPTSVCSCWPLRSRLSARTWPWLTDLAALSREALRTVAAIAVTFLQAAPSVEAGVGLAGVILYCNERQSEKGGGSTGKCGFIIDFPQRRSPTTVPCVLTAHDGTRASIWLLLSSASPVTALWQRHPTRWHVRCIRCVTPAWRIRASERFGTSIPGPADKTCWVLDILPF